jgi:hypothetical protein
VISADLSHRVGLLDESRPLLPRGPRSRRRAG